MKRAIVLLLVVACGATEKPPPRPVGLDAGGVCADACAKRAALGCIDAAMREDCVPTCERAARAGLYAPACVVAATTRDQLAACRVRCP